MNIFGFELIEVISLCVRARHHCLQAVCDLLRLFSREHSGNAQSFSMRKARAHVGGKEPPVKAKGTIERREPFVRRFTKTPAPQILRFAQPDLHASSELLQCNTRAILCIYAALMQINCIGF